MLEIRTHIISDTYNCASDRDGQIKMTNDAAMSLQEAAREKRDSIPERVAMAKQIVDSDPEAHFLLWHDLEDERHALEQVFPTIGDYKQSDVSSCLKARDCGDACLVADCAGVDCRNMTETVELYPTLQAKTNGGYSLNFLGAVRVRYIVRRLTPTECARLQGFPDDWGHPDHNEDFTNDEYSFWLNVRNTYAAINGKAVRQYTRQQMLAWYNKLHTDSAEYKMWGNGIALPCALYVMQGIQAVLNGGGAG